MANDFSYGDALSWFGRGLQAYGIYRAGKAQAKGYRRSAATDLFTAKEVWRQAGWETKRIDQELRRRLGTARASFATAGLEQTGSVKDVLAGITRELNADHLMVQANANAQVRGLKHSAYYKRKAAKNIETTATISAFGSLFS